MLQIYQCLLPACSFFLLAISNSYCRNNTALQCDNCNLIRHINLPSSSLVKTASSLLTHRRFIESNLATFINTVTVGGTLPTPASARRPNTAGIACQPHAAGPYKLVLYFLPGDSGPAASSLSTAPCAAIYTTQHYTQRRNYYDYSKTHPDHHLH